MNRAPNFIVVGAAKSGTTSIHYYLKQHPEIYLPENKESFFFAGISKTFYSGEGSEYGSNIIENWEDYLTIYENASKEIAIGEVCVAYLYFYKNSIERIKKYLPSDIKILIILRNPIDRAFSNYKHHVRDNLEALTFEKAIEPETISKRLEEKWWWGFDYISPGMYYEQIKAYLDAFKEVRIIFYEDFEQDTRKTLKYLFEFLGVDDSFEPDISEKHNVSEIEINTDFKKFLNDPNHSIKKTLRPILLNTIGIRYTEKIVNFFKDKNTLKIKPKTRQKMIKLYRDDILKLGELIDRDLSRWLK